MMRTTVYHLFILLICYTFSTPVQSQVDGSFTSQDMLLVLDSLTVALKKNYAFPDKAHSIRAELEERLRKKAYSSIETREEFASQLARDLVDVSGDLHFTIGVDSTWVAEQRSLDDPEIKDAVDRKNYLMDQQKNFGFQDARILEGNVGYINFTYFADPNYAHEAAEAVMRMVENVDALIIDQRYNNGGYLEMAQLLASYFFPADEEQMLFDYYYLDDGKRIDKRQWVLPSVPGKRMLKAPLYILTSSTSFSAAEWFAYVLKNIGRATVVGEKTAGGAHPVTRIPIDNQFFVQVPIGEIRGPIYGEDFEGKGVSPNIETPAYRALNTAHCLALNTIAADLAKKDLSDWYLPILSAREKPVRLTKSEMDLIIGKYEGRNISFDGQELIYSWGKGGTLRLIPLSKTFFAFEGFDGFRLEFIFSEGKCTGVQRVYRNGKTQLHRRLN